MLSSTSSVWISPGATDWSSLKCDPWSCCWSATTSSRDQRDKSGIVILDPTKEKSDDNLRRFQSFLLAHSEHLDPLHIVEGAFFAKSHTSNLIQIADVCTNVFYREVTRGTKAKEYKAMQKRFWRRGGRLTGVGIKKWP